MRLLHFDQAGRLLLADFSGKTTPPYAILSHRWGDSEVLFTDIADRTYEDKEGYRKIKFCAEQAAKDQLQYFWVDTCCIDKWNLSELSRSINSMFRWYKDARKCYVFLQDVSVPTAAATIQQSDWEASFRASDWFYRGWTLQELVAPQSVDFFSREGHRIGDKRSLEQLINEISHIPIMALQGYSLDKFSILERIGWTKSRKTTEEEDIVYCLLGILNISMPVSYGEGRKKALMRLEAEVNSSAPFIIPFSQNENFAGGDLQLAELEAKLFKCEQPQHALVAIAGPAGTGKSQLALELAYRTQNQDKSCSIFWIDAGSIDGLHQSYESIARKLQISGWDDDKPDFKHIVKQYLSRRDVGKSLLIFDGADSVDLQSDKTSTGQESGLKSYLPESELCHILLTTTNNDAARTLSPNVIEIQALEQDTAEDMLERYLDSPVSRDEQLDAKLLLQELSHLPLAIVQAAAYINTQDITLQEYRKRLTRQRQTDLESNSELLENTIREDVRENPVSATLYLSIEQIRHDSPLAAEYLFFAACVDRKDILLEFLEAPSSREREDAIRIINSYKLVTRRPAESALDFHQLVHDALRQWIWKRGIIGKWAQTVITRLCGIFPSDDGNRSKWRRMLPHANYALSRNHPDQESPEKMELAWRCAEALMSDGKYDESERLLKQVMATSKTYSKPENPNTLMSMGNLAITYWYQGRWLEAEELLVEVIKISKIKLGKDHPDTLTRIGHLAMTYRRQGKLKKAKELDIQVANTRKEKLGADHLHTLTSMGSLASTYWSQGQFDEAERLDLQVIEARKAELGVDHPDTLKSMGNLALTYHNQGRYKEAEMLGMQVIETRRIKLGADHPETLISMANLALTYQGQGRWPEAEALDTQVLETRTKKLGADHPSTLLSLHNLAYTLKARGSTDRAISSMESYCKLGSVVYGIQHPDILSASNDLTSWQLETDMEVASSEGWSLLNVAAMNGHFKIVKWLLKKGGDAAAASKEGWTPLGLAANSGHLKIVKLLLGKGADIAVANNEGWTPLNAAVINSHHEVVKLLLKRGADMAVANNEGWTPLGTAVSISDVESVKLLLENGADVATASNESWTPLYVALNNGHFTIAKLLLEKGADVAVEIKKDWAILNLAASKGYFEVVKLLLEKGADVAAANNSGELFYMTALNGHLEVIKLLLEKADFRAPDGNDRFFNNALYAASYGGHEQIVRFLLEKGVSVDAHGEEYGTALQAAILTCSVPLVRLLLDRGADPAARDKHGWTPSMIAFQTGNREIRDIFGVHEYDLLSSQNECLTPSMLKALRASTIHISSDGTAASTDQLNSEERKSKVQIRSDHPFPIGRRLVYFEVTIHDVGMNGEIGVGFCREASPYTGMPGWKKGSWAYHGDDGLLYLEKEQGAEFGETYGVGDVIGCGSDIDKDEFFFTKNGRRVGRAGKSLCGRLFAVVGVGCKSFHFSVNFGPDGFMFSA